MSALKIKTMQDVSPPPSRGTRITARTPERGSVDEQLGRRAED